MSNLYNFKKENKDKIAIQTFNNQFFTYEKLRNQIKSISDNLKNLNLVNKKIAVLGSNGAEALVAILSCASVSTCVPLNPTIKQDELEYFISELGIDAILTTILFDFGSINKKIPIFEINLGSDDLLELKIINKIKQNIKINKANDIAIILHTSGTTAKPKIVPLSRSNIIASANNIISALKLTSTDKCLNIMPFFHIHGLMVAISTLQSGGTIICPPKFVPSQFYQWLENFKPTWYTASPTIHQSIVDLAKTNIKIIKKSKLRFIRSSSAAMPIKLLIELEKIFCAPVAESYGMSEATLQITSNPPSFKLRKLGSVGKAHGLQIMVINEKGKKLKSGEIGEVVIRGKNIIKKYENAKEVNKKSFLRGWLRTGDLGYIDLNDFLFIKGRIKEMINKGGEKISPLEIDEALMKNSHIKVAVAFSVPHPSLGEDIGAVVILNKKLSIGEKKIKAFLKKIISDFKIPSRIFIVDEIPKGPTGKMQRIGLYEKIKPLFVEKKVLPKNKIEKEIMKIWQNVLNNKSISLDDNFFEIGGDSLKTKELINSLEKEGYRIINDEIFLDNPTIRGMVKLIRRK